MTDSKTSWLARGSAIAIMMAAGIALAACGGGDNGLSQSEEDELQEMLEAAEAEAAAEKAAKEKAETAAAAEKAAREKAEAAAAAEKAAKETAEAAQAKAEADAAAADAARKASEAAAKESAAAAEQAAKDAADAAELANQAAADLLEAQQKQKEAEDALDIAEANEDAAERRRQEAVAAEEAARREAEAARDQAEAEQEQLERQLTEAEQEALNARASQYIEAINDGGSARTVVTVTYMRGDTLKINPGGNFETGSGAPAISGFTPSTYTRQVGVSGEQTLYHYTNIQPPGTRAFWKIHGLQVAAGSLQDANIPKPNAAAQFITDPANSTNATGVRVSGTYDGVSGTFTCTASGCTGTKSGITLANLVPVAAGVRSLATVSDWSFKPSSITSGVLQDQDTEYLWFGIWVEEPNLASAAHDYAFFTGGSAPFTDVGNAELPGTAKFRGGAVGKYVTRDQVGDNAKVGTFTATANFTATFGTTPTLEGRLTDFRDGSEALTGWSVYLGDTGNVPAPFASGTLTDEFASARIGGVAATGTWDATLYGTPNPGRAQLTADPDAATKYPLARYPVADLAGVVGNFHATNNDTASIATAAIAGAFAATPE